MQTVSGTSVGHEEEVEEEVEMVEEMVNKSMDEIIGIIFFDSQEFSIELSYDSESKCAVILTYITFCRKK